MRNAIEMVDLKKIFHQHTSFKNLFWGRKKLTRALNGISLDIKEGEIFGLLGPNGAGKTTLIKLLTTLILPTEGTAKIHGYDIVKDEWQVRNIIGLIHSDERSFFWRLTGRQNLEFFAAIFKIARRSVKSSIDEVISHVGLEKHADNLFHNYSTGMKQRLAIARGLLNSPKILFMDEAMRAIDPISTQKIRDFIRDMVRSRKDMSIIMATNRLDEATDLCDRVAILNGGNLVHCGTIQEIDDKCKAAVSYEIEVGNMREDIVEEIRGMARISDCRKIYTRNGKTCLSISLERGDEDIHPVLQIIMRGECRVVRCSRREHSFDESFSRIISEFESSNEGGRS